MLLLTSVVPSLTGAPLGVHTNRKTNMSEFGDWIGRSQSATDVLDPGRSNALGAAFGHEAALRDGDPLPPLRHWLYFWDVRPPAALGGDGHPAKGGFLPPVPLPRRMWAGGRVQFQAPLVLGEQATKTSTITKVEEKSGRSGMLVFVTVRHEVAGQSGVGIVEEQDLVYRAAATVPIARPADGPPPDAPWRERVEPDPVLLFRYSALTMNGHRIHYDRPYATGEEAYPALVVHGPLQATLLIDLAQRHAASPIRSFSFRGQQPAFDGAPLYVCGQPDEGGAALWTQQGAAQCMTATARFEGSDAG